MHYYKKHQNQLQSVWGSKIKLGSEDFISAEELTPGGPQNWKSAEKRRDTLRFFYSENGNFLWKKFHPIKYGD